MPRKIWVILCKEIWILCWVWSHLWVSLQGPADISTFSALTNLIPETAAVFLLPLSWESACGAPMSGSEMRCGKPQLALGMDRVVVGGYWGCSVCGKLFAALSFIPVGHGWGTAPQRPQPRGRDLPLTSPGPSFPLPMWGNSNTLRENQRCDISDGSQVTLTRKWGHLSYRISRQLGPFWNLQKAESWRLGAWNAIKFKYGKIYSLWLWYGKTLVPDLKHVGQIVLRFKHVFELFLGINPVSSPSHRSYICRTFWHDRVSPDINVILSRTSLTV